MNPINSCLVANGPISIVLAAHNNNNSNVKFEHDPLLPTYKISFSAAVFHYLNVQVEAEVSQEWMSSVCFNQVQSLENSVFLPMLGTLEPAAISY